LGLGAVGALLIKTVFKWSKARGSISLGAGGLNTRVKLTFRTSYGFRTLKSTPIMLYQAIRDLTEPPETYRFL